jgi:hypothetical protein
MQGQVINSLHIDPALTAQRQGAYLQAPAPQTNLYNGARAIFSGHPFQQLQGNQNVQSQATAQPVDNDDHNDGDAQMFKDFLHEFSYNDSSPNKYEYDQTMPAHGLDTFHNNYKDPYDGMPPPSLPKAAALKAGGYDFMIYTQRNSE